MKRTALAIASVVAVGLTLPALAQAPKPAQPANTASTVKVPSGVFFKRQAPGQYLARDKLIGAKVVNKDGIIIGDIEDVILNTKDNQVEGVIMGVGGFLGAGEKKVGVRYSALQITTKDGKYTVALPQATKEVLAALEPYQRGEAKKSLVERAKEKAKELTDKVKESDAAAKAKELGGKAVEAGKQAVDTAKEKAGIGQPAPKQ